MSSFVIPAVKWGATALGLGFLGKKASQAGGKPSAAEEKYGREASGAATTLKGQGNRLFNFGMPQLEQGTRFFGDLLRGSRAGLSQAIQPEATATRELYRGAGRGIERSNLRGAARDLARADLSREATGRVAGLLPSVRAGAATSLIGAGQYGTSAGTGAVGQAGGILADLLKGAQSQRLQETLLKQQAGGGIADIFFSILPMLLGSGKSRNSVSAPPPNEAEG